MKEKKKRGIYLTIDSRPNRHAACQYNSDETECEQRKAQAASKIRLNSTTPVGYLDIFFCSKEDTADGLWPDCLWS
jgi:hypothetical protein